MAQRHRDWGQITEGELERVRARIGVERTTDSSFFRHNANYQGGLFHVTPTYVKQYATGIADLNPLYVDPDYAATTIWQRQQAPPPMTCWTERANGATEGFPGCHTIWRGCDFTWDRPIFVGDALSSVTRLVDARIVSSRFSDAAAIQDYETTVETSTGEPIGTYRTSWHRFSREVARDLGREQHGSSATSERPAWTDEDLMDIRKEYAAQNARRQGATLRYFEDIAGGESIPYLVKGPTTLTSKMAFEAINFPGGWVVGHELANELFEAFPNLPIRNEENVPEPPVAIHWTNERCQTHLGLPAAYEAGYERLHWLNQLLATWAGDHSLLRALSVQFRGFHWQGDVIRLYGEVSDRRRDGDECLIDLDIRTETHRGAVTTTGTATVQLPSRDGPPVWGQTQGEAGRNLK